MNPAPDQPIASVEDLVSLLGEAAEIEHGLMCCYLYAAWALKTADGELPPHQLAAVRRWERAITGVAIEEMGHLALVSNLMCALGVRPHFGRQNFPVAPGYHPASITVMLAPLTRATLDHFIFLERPETAHETDGDGFETAHGYTRGGAGDSRRLTPVARDYETVGQLYATVAQGLRGLCARFGETTIFCGRAHGQVGPDLAALPGMRVVDGLDSALAAIEAIVSQGEGSAAGATGSHYARFLTIREQWDAIAAADPAFEPSRPAATNPVMRRPPSPETKVFIDAPDAARVLDLANALYNHMLRCLVQAWGRSTDEAGNAAALIDAAISLIYAAAPAARALTHLPASPVHPGVNAGMSFATMRFYQPFIERGSEWRLLASRTAELAAGARAVAALVSEAPRLADDLDALAAKLRSRNARAPAAPSASAPPPADMRPHEPEIVDGEAMTIVFRGDRCIHARFCVTQTPQVFLANTPGEWIRPDAADAETLVGVAKACPSGAITYRRRDGGPEDAPPPVNLLNIRENGPYAIRGAITVNGERLNRATLCRCGLSARKPFCDGRHTDGAFTATGEPPTGDLTALAARDSPLEVRPTRKGPLAVTGNLEICAGTGRAVARVAAARLVRCGHSANKPFCDGSHARAGFRAGGA